MIAKNYVVFIEYKTLHKKRKNRTRDFSQGLYTFSLKLELYLPGRAPNRVGPQHGCVANLGRKSWS